MQISPFAPFFVADIASIDVSDRLRPTDPSKVQALAASINEIDLQQPIVVRAGTDGQNSLRLVSGMHRIEAVQLLGWTEIPARYAVMDDEQARLAEIDENLFRSGLSQLERGIFWKERKSVYEALHPEAAHGKASKPKKNNELAKVANIATFQRYSKEAAAKAGVSERLVQLAVKMIDELDPEAVRLLHGTPIADNQAQLLKLAREPRDHQAAFARELAEGKARTVQRARVTSGYHPEGGAVRPAERGLEAFERICHSLPLEKLRVARGILEQIILLAEEADTKVSERKVAKKARSA